MRSRSAPATRAISCSTGASSAIGQRVGQRRQPVLAHADDHRDERRGLGGLAGERGRGSRGRRRPARTARWRTGLISASAVAAPAQDASTTGNAPASVNACAKPPVGLSATMRIGPCSDMVRTRHADGEDRKPTQPPLTSRQRSRGASRQAARKGVGQQRIDAEPGERRARRRRCRSEMPGEAVSGERVGQAP